MWYFTISPLTFAQGLGIHISSSLSTLCNVRRQRIFSAHVSSLRRRLLQETTLVLDRSLPIKTTKPAFNRTTEIRRNDPPQIILLTPCNGAYRINVKRSIHLLGDIACAPYRPCYTQLIQTSYLPMHASAVCHNMTTVVRTGLGNTALQMTLWRSGKTTLPRFDVN